MRTSDAAAWIGAVMLIGGIVVAAAVSPLTGLVLAVLGGAVLVLVRRREDSSGDGEPG